MSDYLLEVVEMADQGENSITYETEEQAEHCLDAYGFDAKEQEALRNLSGLDSIGIEHIASKIIIEMDDTNIFKCMSEAERRKLIIDAWEQKRKMDLEKSESAAELVKPLLDKIEKRQFQPATPTGYSNLDNALGGGLFPGLFCVGAISSLGKTTFCLQMADQIASTGKKVLVYSLEMAAEELIAKSLSRLTFKDARAKATDQAYADAFTTRDVLDGKRWENYQDSKIEALGEAEYKYKQFAKNLYIKQGIGDIGVKQIRDEMTKYKDILGEAPVLIIDYLQIIAPYNDRATDKQNTDKAVLELKRISRDFETPVICISSLNRVSYYEPISVSSFKESGAIEYSSDVLIGLQYQGLDDTDTEAEGKEIAKKADETARLGKPVDIQLKILKNRNGVKDSVGFRFYSKYNYFVTAEFRPKTN